MTAVERLSKLNAEIARLLDAGHRVGDYYLATERGHVGSHRVVWQHVRKDGHPAVTFDTVEVLLPVKDRHRDGGITMRHPIPLLSWSDVDHVEILGIALDRAAAILREAREDLA